MHSYLVRENVKKKSNKKSTWQLKKMTGDMLHISVYSVHAIIESAAAPPKPKKKRKVKLDGFDKEVIRRMIHTMYGERVLPTIPLIQARLAHTNIKISNSTLRLVLHEIGYVFRKTEDNRKIVAERPEGVAARARFLCEIRKYRAAGFQVVYVDETWVNQYACRNLAWYPKLSSLLALLKRNDVGFEKLPNIPSGKGKRLVILHAGSAEHGFLPGCEKVFLGTHDKSGDYHTEMNTKLFMEWFSDLVESLEEPSVIVIDNASYHNALTDDSKSLNSNTRKDDMKAWLRGKGVAYTEEMLKPEIYELVKFHKPPKVYQTDVLAETYGHAVLRTPPRQCELNAIELIWAIVKKQVAARNTGMKIAQVEQLTKDVLRSVTREQWQRVVRHTIDVENLHWKADGLREQVEPIIIHINSDESDDDSDDSDDDSDETVDESNSSDEVNTDSDDKEQLTDRAEEWHQLFGDSDDSDFDGF